MSNVIDQLKAEFPRNAISWRAQSVTKSGDKAMALAYIDARDVMNRLDEVCGAGDWQDRYEVHGAKTICYLSVRIDGEWITKADGAGDTDVEAEKGSISDAFKRAAVKWGIGRYLYDLDAPWVPCDSYETTRNGKTAHVWRAWKADPWSFIRNSSSAPSGRNAAGANSPSAPHKPAPAATPSQAFLAFREVMRTARSKADLREWWFATKDQIAEELNEAEGALLVGERNTLAQTLPEFAEAA